MPVYTWEAQTGGGGTRRGEMEAQSEQAVIMALRRQQLTPGRVRAKGAPRRGLFPRRVTTRDVVIFTRQFATMIDAGLPLVQCLEILGGQQENSTFKSIIKQIKEDVESGSTFAEALGKHRRVFDDLYVNLVAAGEVGGILDTILNRLATYMEKAEKLKKKVKGAMVYPASIVVVAVLVIIVLLLFVVPVFEKMFADFGAALPAPTQIVINISNAVKSYWYIMFGTLFGVVVISYRFYKTDAGRAIVDKYSLRLPVLGDLIRKSAVAKFTRTLGTMISSGVPIIDALEICSKTSGNKTVEAALRQTRAAISEGRTMADPLAACGVFPSMVVQMISVGEATGALDTMLNKIADFYDDEVDEAVAALTSLMEPMIMVFLGGAIGGLVVAMYLPIFKMASVIG